jgi:hypothetical protein
MNQGQMIGGYAAIGGAAGYGADAKLCEAQRQAEIPHQMERLSRTLEGCLKGLEVLGEKLEASVMRGEPPQNAGQNGITAAVPSTPYGSRLYELTSLAAIVSARIESLSQRLEV